MKPSLPRSLWPVAFSLTLLLFGVTFSLRAASPPSVAPSVVSSEPLVLPHASCTNEPLGREPSPVSLTPLGSQASFWTPPDYCGDICQSNCEALCGVGFGRCNPMSSCVCECW
jgi:hypothetical protein